MATWLDGITWPCACAYAATIFGLDFLRADFLAETGSLFVVRPRGSFVDFLDTTPVAEGLWSEDNISASALSQLLNSSPAKPVSSEYISNARTAIKSWRS